MTTPAVPPSGSRENAAQAASLQILADGAASRPRGRRPPQTSEARLEAADERDVVALARDVAARTRDHAADERTRAPGRRLAVRLYDPAAPPRIVVRRSRAARHRARAAEQGALAAGDRRAAAGDREQAACERLHALVDREELADELALTDVDALTGARTRAAGLRAFERELQRCRRTGLALTVTYVDVVGLKAVNDTLGHGVGDELLRSVVRHMYEHLRSYDLVVRLGGDEFLCAAPDMALADSRRRFAGIAAALAALPGGVEIRTGFAEYAPGESGAELVARADAQLIDRPHATHAAAEPAAGASQPHARVVAAGENVAPLRDAVVAFAAAHGATERQGEDIAVVLAEALGNTVVHAYAGCAEPGPVSLDAWISADALHVVVCDEGGGIQPRRRSPGLGLGLALIIRLTRRLEIEETTAGTRLHMTFAIG